jgi:ATP-binding cassette subfamily B protein
MARPIAHSIIIAAVLAAVGCSVGAQYGVKLLVDILAGGNLAGDAASAWLGFLFLASLIAADNLLWRLAGWIASSTFVGVTGDLRRDLFRHLTGHAPGYFADRMPGTLTSRVTATSNAIFTLENMFVWNVLPPCVATFVAILFVLTVSVPMAATLMALAGILVLTMMRLAAAGRPLHHEFANRAAAATFPWSGPSAASAASTSGSMPRSIARWRRAGAASITWRNCGCSTLLSP